MAILNPYLTFHGNAREAIEFYKDVFGGELNIMTFGDMGASEHEGSRDPAGRRHARAADHRPGLHADGLRPAARGLRDHPQRSHQPERGQRRRDLLRGYFDQLAEGGHIDVPLEKAPWGDEFGQVKDKFGVNWLVNIAGSQG